MRALRSQTSLARPRAPQQGAVKDEKKPQTELRPGFGVAPSLHSGPLTAKEEGQLSALY